MAHIILSTIGDAVTYSSVADGVGGWTMSVKPPSAFACCDNEPCQSGAWDVPTF